MSVYDSHKDVYGNEVKPLEETNPELAKYFMMIASGELKAKVDCGRVFDKTKFDFKTLYFKEVNPLPRSLNGLLGGLFG